MFRIRQVPDDVLPSNAAAVRQVLDILAEQFPLLEEDARNKLSGSLRDPLKQKLRPLLLVAEDARDRVRGFAWALHAPDVRFVYLDFIATAKGVTGGGVGGALYERVRDTAAALGDTGIFLECLPDDPALSPDAKVRRQNEARLKFYERYGARPITGTLYETPVNPSDTDPPYLVYDPLGAETMPSATQARRIVRAILERKYGDICPPAYIDRVVKSFKGEHIELRPYRYLSSEPAAAQPSPVAKIALVVTDEHEIHHVADRGYVEAPVRIRAIAGELAKTDLFQEVTPRRFPDRHIRAVHSGRYAEFIKAACANVEPRKSVYPYVFPIRNAARPPKDLPLQAGYYCIDTFTPLNDHAYRAARRAVDCALTASEEVVGGKRLAYALIRPPGHHAERRAFGGFCYFNNAAVAANYLSRYGRVAVLDIDYHHGNGTQDIFYHRRDVLTVSIHGHPSFAYPYFSGFRNEDGVGPGAGFNLNIPLSEHITAEDYRSALQRALRRVATFAPHFLVLAVGFDTAVGDPTGSWPHRAADFERLGRDIGATGVPVVAIQEGGYRTRTLGVNARHFFNGLARGAGETPLRQDQSQGAPAALTVEWRNVLYESDPERIRSLVAASGVFSAAEVTIARELVEERLARGHASGYDFILAERGHRLIGYACYGEIPAAQNAFDLYWIVVDPEAVGGGIGRQLLSRVEADLTGRGGRILYTETSDSDSYAPARAFYRASGFRKAATVADHYAPGEANVIYAKTL